MIHLTKFVLLCLLNQFLNDVVGQCRQKFTIAFDLFFYIACTFLDKFFYHLQLTVRYQFSQHFLSLLFQLNQMRLLCLCT